MNTKNTMLFGLACLLGTQACWEDGPTPSQPGLAPDLTVEDFRIDRAPMQGQPFNVTIGVANYGAGPVPAGSVVQWFARQADPFPSCEWSLQAIAVREQVRVACEYAGYSSSYPTVNMKVEVDAYDLVDEGDPSREANNIFIYTTNVR
jgi:hypothetical protein